MALCCWCSRLPCRCHVKCDRDCNQLLVELTFERIVFNQLQMRQNNRHDVPGNHLCNSLAVAFLSFYGDAFKLNHEEPYTTYRGNNFRLARCSVLIRLLLCNRRSSSRHIHTHANLVFASLHLILSLLYRVSLGKGEQPNEGTNG